MKVYREVLADAYVLRDVLEYLSGQADRAAYDAALARERLSEPENVGDEYYLDQVSEYEAKAAAFERLLEEFSK